MGNPELLGSESKNNSFSAEGGSYFASLACWHLFETNLQLLGWPEWRVFVGEFGFPLKLPWEQEGSMCHRGSSQHGGEELWGLMDGICSLPFPPLCSFLLALGRLCISIPSHFPAGSCCLMHGEKLSEGRISAQLHKRHCWAPCWSKCSHASGRQRKQQSKAALIPPLKVVLKSFCLVSSRQQGLDCRHVVTSPFLAVLLQMQG